MEYIQGRPEGPSRIAPDTVTGNMMLDRLLHQDGVAVADVVFEPGARTWWHTHEHGQIFMIDQGKGYIGTRGAEPRLVQRGDLIYTPAGEEHWHGAAEDCFIAYRVITLGTIAWGSEVSEEEYLQSP